MELLQLLNVPVVQCPGLTPTEERCEDNGTVDLEPSGESDVVLVEHTSAKPSKCLACFTDLSVMRSIAGDDAAQILDVLSIFFSWVPSTKMVGSGLRFCSLQPNEGLQSCQG